MGARGVPSFTGAVLCGGRSRRMGRDKALIEVGGVAMARRVADALLAAGAEAVVAQGGDTSALRALGLPTCEDTRPGAGPLSATIDALRNAPIGIVLVVSCDLVAPDPTVMARTVDDLAGHPRGDVAVPVVAGHRQWLHAAWRTRAVPGLAAALDDGVRSLRQAAERLSVVEVLDVPAHATEDADTPAELGPHGSAMRGR